MTIRLTCPRCKTCFRTEQAPIVQCENCGTSIRPKAKAATGWDGAIQTFERFLRGTLGI